MNLKGIIFVTMDDVLYENMCYVKCNMIWQRVDNRYFELHD